MIMSKNPSNNFSMESRGMFKDPDFTVTMMQFNFGMEPRVMFEDSDFTVTMMQSKSQVSSFISSSSKYD